MELKEPLIILRREILKLQIHLSQEMYKIAAHLHANEQYAQLSFESLEKHLMYEATENVQLSPYEENE